MTQIQKNQTMVKPRNLEAYSLRFENSDATADPKSISRPPADVGSVFWSLDIGI
jgi:hypothetical protein